MLPRLNIPSLCRICHAWPSQTLCASCIERFAQPVLRCTRCALASDRPVCLACARNPPPLDACVAAVHYAFPWNHCITDLKFHADASLARALAALMRHAPWVEPALEQADWLIPMPLTRQRLRERGFNQSLELARHLAPKKLKAHALLRSGASAPQVGASRAERLTHMQDNYWVPPDALASVQGKRVVLLDDVMTTGATLHHAARALRAAGVAHITGLVLARTPFEK